MTIEKPISEMSSDERNALRENAFKEIDDNTRDETLETLSIDPEIVQESEKRSEFLNDYLKSLIPKGTNRKDEETILKGELDSLITQRENGKYNKDLEDKITLVSFRYHQLIGPQDLY